MFKKLRKFIRGALQIKNNNFKKNLNIIYYIGEITLVAFIIISICKICSIFIVLLENV